MLQSLTEEEWNRASVYDITTTTALARINENVDLTEHGFFAKSIEKLKSATLVSAHLPYINVSRISLIGYP